MNNSTPAPTVLDRIRDLITEYVILPDESYADLLALYVLHTHTFIMEESADEDDTRGRVLSRKSPSTTPYFYITSQGPGSGKTRLMEVLVEVCKGGRMFSGGTGPAFFRLIEARRPTLFIDEVDTIYSGSKDEDLRQVLNGGYKRNGSIPRVDNSSDDGIRDYGTFCPKILGGIDNGHVPTTVLDRAIKITMVKSAGIVAPFFSEDIEDIAADLMDDIGTWIAANIGDLHSRENRPAPIDGITDRQNDIVRPLVTIADRFPGWGKRARIAVVAAFREQATPLTREAHALAVVRDYMLAHDLDSITTARVAELTGQNGKQIATWFGAFGIAAPGTYSFINSKPEARSTTQPASKQKGYKLDSTMRAAWTRFLPALPANVDNS
jgi:hypothetical protein